jgi:hypothetical protein
MLRRASPPSSRVAEAAAALRFAERRASSAGRPHFGRTRTDPGRPTVASVPTGGPGGAEPDLAEELELRDELLLACRDVLLRVGTRRRRRSSRTSTRCSTSTTRHHPAPSGEGTL